MTEYRMEETVFQVTGRIVAKLSHMRDTSSGKANLANLRNSVGRPLSETIDIWPLVFSEIPDAFLSRSGVPTHHEKAILTALQLYALHQQGKPNPVCLNEATDQWENIGSSMSHLRDGESLSTDKRFNAMVTASTFEELTHHLRQLVKILKAKSEVKVNYAKLADDLYWFQKGNKERMRIRWAQSYYRIKKAKGENENE